jgi:A/G-specific adenine glycosylase
MDLGASICTPRRPACPRCPLAEFCLARRLGRQEQRPVRAARRAVPHYTVAAAVIRRNGTVLIARRPARGLLGGLWEFPGGKQQAGEDLPACLKREIREELEVEIAVGAPLGMYRHGYTHFHVTLHAFECALLAGEPRPVEASDLRWVPPADLGGFPMGKIDRQISRSLLGSQSEGEAAPA